MGTMAKVIFIFACAAICLWAIIWKKLGMLKCTQPVQATFEGLNGYSGKVRSFVVTVTYLFTYEYNNQSYNAVQSITSMSALILNRTKFMQQLKYQKGECYTIYVNPNNPKRFITEDKDNNGVLWFGFILLSLLGMLGIQLL